MFAACTCAHARLSARARKNACEALFPALASCARCKSSLSPSTQSAAGVPVSPKTTRG